MAVIEEYLVILNARVNEAAWTLDETLESDRTRVGCFLLPRRAQRGAIQMFAPEFWNCNGRCGIDSEYYQPVCAPIKVPAGGVGQSCDCKAAIFFIDTLAYIAANNTTLTEMALFYAVMNAAYNVALPSVPEGSTTCPSTALPAEIQVLFCDFFAARFVCGWDFSITSDADMLIMALHSNENELTYVLTVTSEFFTNGGQYRACVSSQANATPTLADFETQCPSGYSQVSLNKLCCELELPDCCNEADLLYYQFQMPDNVNPAFGQPQQDYFCLNDCGLLFPGWERAIPQVSFPADPAFEFTGSFTIEMLFKQSGGGINLSMGNVATGGLDRLQVLWTADDILTFFIANETEQGSIQVLSYPIPECVHLAIVAFTQDATLWKIYVNGNLVAFTTVQNTLSLLPTFNNSFKAIQNGNVSGTGGLLMGTMRLWDKAITDVEAQELYNDGYKTKNLTDAEIKLESFFESASGTTIEDSSSLELDGYTINFGATTDVGGGAWLCDANNAASNSAGSGGGCYLQGGWTDRKKGAWLATAKVYSDECRPIRFDDYVEAAFVGKDNQGRDIQNIIVNPKFLPIRFALEFIFNNGDGTTTSVFTEQYEKLVCGTRTITLEGTYPATGASAFDCRGLYYGTDYACMKSYAGGVFIHRNKVRVPGELIYSGFSTDKEEENYRTKRADITERYTLRTGLLPPYVVEEIQNIFAAQSLFINGEEYFFSGEVPKNVQKGTMWRIEVDVEKRGSNACLQKDYTCT